MVYNIIADAGSTKIQWALIDVADGYVKLFRTTGINPVTSSNKEVEEAMCEAAGKLPDDAEIEAVQYYGAGCATEAICNRMREIIGSAFDCRNVEVNSDLAGAAKSLLGNQKGIACILGTGSNSCLYDGHRILSNTPSLGYVLGDEGSGNAIGRRLLSDYYKGAMPDVTARKFAELPAADISFALQNTYHNTCANRWLASLAEFAAVNIGDDYIEDVVKEEFNRFIDRNLMPYSKLAELSDIPVSFTGGIAAGFSHLLEEVCSERGLNLNCISREPIEGLVKHWLKARCGTD